MKSKLVPVFLWVFVLSSCSWLGSDSSTVKKTGSMTIEESELSNKSMAEAEAVEEGSTWGNFKTWCSDASITFEIKFRLIKDPYIDAIDIKVITENGVVTLIGYVKKTTDIERAATLVMTTHGVTGLVNLLQVVFG